MEQQEAYRDTVDLVQLVKVLLKRKWLVVVGTLAFTLAAVLLALVLPKAYMSEGFIRLSSGEEYDLEELKEIQERIREDFQKNLMDNVTLQRSLLLNEVLRDSSLTMSSVNIPDYKKYQSQFTSPQQFLRFIAMRRETGGPGSKHLAELELNVRYSEDILQWLEAVYAYSKKDISQGQVAKDVRNFVVGVQIRGEQPSPKKARALVSVMGGFIKDSIIYGKLSDYINTHLNKSQADAKIYENYVIQDQFKLEQLAEKQDLLNAVLKKYPQAKTLADRELFSILGSGHRYLSPVSQLIGIESHSADIKENLSGNQRSRQVEEVRFKFMTEAKKFLAEETFGEALFHRCTRLKDVFFKQIPGQTGHLGGEYPKGVRQQVENEITKDFINLNNLGDEMRFLSGPTQPVKPVKPKKALIAVIGLLLGFFIFVFLAFFVEWWEMNKNTIDT